MPNHLLLHQSNFGSVKRTAFSHLLLFITLLLLSGPGYGAGNDTCNSGTGVPCESPLTLNFMPSLQESKTQAAIVTSDEYQWQIVSGCCSKGNVKISGQTPFLTQNDWNLGTAGWQLPQVVGVNGIDYYHMIVGDQASGFIQETWIPLGWNMDFTSAAGHPSNSPMTYKWAVNQYNNAGNYTAGSCGTTCISLHSASGGDSKVTNMGPASDVGNGMYPLDAPTGKNSGNGSGNPTKVIMRQELTDGQGTFSNVFLKSAFTQKPVITQDVGDANVMSHVVIDMSNSDYNTMTTAGTMTNTLTSPTGVIPSMKEPAGSISYTWDMAVDSQAGKTNVDAGMYTYTPGPSGTGLTDWGGANGSYTYSSGSGFDIASVKWSDFMDPSSITTNPWSYNTYKPVK